MIKIIKDSLKDKRGNGFVWACVVLLVLLIVFFGLSEDARNHMTTRGVRQGLESVATTIATNNYDEIYRSEREGYFSAYTIDDKKTNKWEEKIENDNLDEYLETALGVQKKGSKYVKETPSGQVEFELTDVEVNIVNPNFAPSDEDKNKETFTVEITSDLKIYPMFKLGDGDEIIEVKVGAKSGYIPKF